MKALTKPSVTSIQDANGRKLTEITLKPGDRPTIIVVTGRNLQNVRQAQLFGQKRVGQGHVEVKILESSLTKLKLSLQAKTTMFKGGGFYLQLQDTNQNRLADVKVSRISLGGGAVKVAARTPAPKPGQKAPGKPTVPTTRQPARPVIRSGTKKPPTGGQPSPEIMTAKPNVVKLVPAGGPKYLNITGKNLNVIRGVQVLKNDEPVSNQKISAVIMQSRSLRSMRLDFRASKKADPGKNYQIAFVDANQTIIAKIPLPQSAIIVEEKTDPPLPAVDTAPDMETGRTITTTTITMIGKRYPQTGFVPKTISITKFTFKGLDEGGPFTPKTITTATIKMTGKRYQ